MNVLIIEDDANKLRALHEFILQYYHSTNCDCKMSFHSGMAALYSQSYDLLLLDMSMPIYDVTIRDTGGRPLPLAGRDILFKMKRNNLQTKVIIITQYEDFEGTSLSELEYDLENNFPQLYCGSVYYNTTHDTWKENLSTLLKTLFSEREDQDDINTGS